MPTRNGSSTWRIVLLLATGGVLSLARIPVTCQPRDGHPRGVQAPFIEGTLYFQNEAIGSALFLIDTGADSTLLDTAKVPVPAHIMQTGKKEQPMGVGGHWPARKFKGGWKIELLLDDPPSSLMLDFPSLTIMSPWARRTTKRHGRTGSLIREEETGPFVPTDRAVISGEVQHCPPMECLLGRDFLVHHNFSLHYCPTEASFLERLDVPKVNTVQTALPAAEPVLVQQSLPQPVESMPIQPDAAKRGFFSRLFRR